MKIVQTWAALVVVATASLLRAEPPRTMADIRVFAVYEPVFTRQDADILSRVQPDFVCRGWFKWGSTPDWQTVAPLAQACRERGILLQGGITLAALYPGENGMDDAAFRDFACHGTDGNPYLCGPSVQSGWYHLSLYNPKVIEYLKREARLQLDAGAVGIWYDEIEGYYDWNPTEGYDPYACAAFRDWLIRKYCTGQGWREDDPRWHTQFGIDLAKHGGSIRTFDYLRHLQTTPGNGGKPLAADPPQGNPRGWAASANPLYREWGYAWDRKAQGTFRFDTVAATFADILADADRYAREKHGRTLISTYNHNGTARRGVAFQQPHNGAQPPLRKNRLDGRVSYLSFYEDLIADAAEVCPEQPVVFFVDWPGETDLLTALPRADQTHFFNLYIPEAYAAGGEFALPLRGYSYIANHQGTLGTLARMADFYREYAPWLRGSRPLPVQPEAQDNLTVRVRPSAGGTAVHLVNHAFSSQEVWPQSRTNVCINLAWNRPAPAGAFTVSPDFPEQRPVPLSLKDGRLTLDVGTVACSALVILPDVGVLRQVTGRAAPGMHILATSGRALAVAQDNRFRLWLPYDATEIECLETGERLHARDGVAFAAPPAGEFASGLLADSFGIPSRHTEIANGSRRWHTDAWGRFRIPLAQTANGQVSACVENGTTNTLALDSAFTAWRLYPSRKPILSLQHLEGERPREPLSTRPASSIDGYWANWPDKDRVPGVITLAREEHLGQPALRCTFAPTPRVPWQNVNSPAFEIGDANAVELVYAGDGSAHTVSAVLFASPAQFYRVSLSLTPTDWTRKRVALGEFRDEKGAPFDPAAVKGNISFQLSPENIGAVPATLWLKSAHLVNDTPVQEMWRNDAPFDAVDLDNLRAGHRPQPPPPVVASRQPLASLAELPLESLANWEGKSSADEKPMVVAERVAPGDQPPFLRVTLPAGECAWGNANIPLRVAQLQGQDGLALHLRVTPANAIVSLSLHAAPQGGSQRFYRSNCEAGDTWADLLLPWNDLRRDDGQAFNPASCTWVNLQLNRPARVLTQAIVIEIEQVDAFTAKR